MSGAAAPGAGSLMLAPAPPPGSSTRRNCRAVTAANATVVGTSATSRSATARQLAPSSLASSRGLTVAGPNIDLPPTMNTVAVRTVRGAG